MESMICLFSLRLFARKVCTYFQQHGYVHLPTATHPPFPSVDMDPPRPYSGGLGSGLW